MDQFIAALAFLHRNHPCRDKRDARAEQAFYATFEGDAWADIARFFARWRGKVRQPASPAGNCHNRMTCLDHSNGRAMG